MTGTLVGEQAVLAREPEDAAAAGADAGEAQPRPQLAVALAVEGAAGQELPDLPLPSLPRLVPRRTRRSISGTAPTRHPCSTTAARHSQPWPRRNRDRFGLALWLWCTSEPGARAEIRSTTVSSMTTCQTGGSNSVASAARSARQTASHARRPRCRNQ